VTALKSKLARVRHRIWERQLPKVFELTDLDPRGVNFEATNLVERSRIVAHGDEPEYFKQMLAFLRPDDVLYDIGANIGLVALHAGLRCRTIAFEPDPSFRSRLLRNLEINPGIPVDVRAVAIGDTDGAATLFTDGAAGHSPSLVHHGEKGAIEIEVQKLDTLVGRGDIPRPTVVKLDIEGAEMLALRGALQLLRGPDAPRALFLEIHDSFLPSFGSSAEEVLAFVREAGYSATRYQARRADQRHLIVERR
jgi:FkbM family methyltransferase